MTHPARLSYELRNAESDELRHRRWIVGLSLFGAAMGALVSLYQVGILRRLPDPPGGLFNATKVDASNYAYKRLDAPDGLLMTLTYAVTALLAGAGGMDRSRSRPWLPLAMAGKAAYDAATTVKLGREEWQENKALCQYCQAATLASFAILALAVPEAISAARTLAGRR